MPRTVAGLEIKSTDELLVMRRAGLVVARALAEMAAAALPGATTADLDAVAREVLAREGATSNFLNYDVGFGIPPYPAVVCISVNDEIVHGIPGSRGLVDGDLVSIDFGAIVDGFHGDSAMTVAVGTVAPEALALSDVTRGALAAGLARVRPEVSVGDISSAVQSYVRDAPARYGIVAEYTGHGIGTRMHMHPDVPNLGRPGRGPKLPIGAVVAIEPMVTLGSPGTDVLDDDWTVVTRDGKVACHWEHSVAVTPGGCWVLTADDGGESILKAAGGRFAPLGD
jgi:methionyl aminopeptidase